MRRAAASQQLAFGWTPAQRWEDLPEPLRDEIRRELRGVLVAVAEASVDEEGAAHV